MSQPQKQSSVKITAMSLGDVARTLSAALNRRVTEEQVRHVAELGDLVQPDDKINLIQYVACLAREVAHGSD